jgi:hypothetical protein
MIVVGSSSEVHVMKDSPRKSVVVVVVASTCARNPVVAFLGTEEGGILSTCYLICWLSMRLE